MFTHEELVALLLDLCRAQLEEIEDPAERLSVIRVQIEAVVTLFREPINTDQLDQKLADLRRERQEFTDKLASGNSNP